MNIFFISPKTVSRGQHPVTNRWTRSGQLYRICSQGSCLKGLKNKTWRHQYKSIGDETLPFFRPSLHTDRPRCYALMREDYLWWPLQSACSMQHLRSVPSPGRQCSPDPTLLTRPVAATLNSRNLPSIFPSPPPAFIYNAGTLSSVLTFHTRACSLKS